MFKTNNLSATLFTKLKKLLTCCNLALGKISNALRRCQWLFIIKTFLFISLRYSTENRPETKDSATTAKTNGRARR